MNMAEWKKTVRQWAKKQKRITNQTLCKEFGLSYEDAEKLYLSLKKEGVIGRMGYMVTENKKLSEI